MLKLLVLLALAAVCIALPDDAWGDSALESQVEADREHEMLQEQNESDVDRKKIRSCMRCRLCWGRRYRVCGRNCCRIGWRCRWYRYRCVQSDDVERKEQEGLECKSCQHCFYKRYFSECKSQCCLIGRDCSSEYCSRRDENEVAEPKIEENDAMATQSQFEGSVDIRGFCCTCGSCHWYCRQCGRRCCCSGGGRCRCRSCHRSGPSFFVNSI